MTTSSYSASYARNKKWGRNGKLSFERIERMQQAKQYLYEMVYTDDAIYVSPDDASDGYYERFPDVDPEPLRESQIDQQQEAWRKFNRGTQPAKRLFAALEEPHLYTLHAEHLGLDPYYADKGVLDFPHMNYDRALRAIWKAKLKEAFGNAPYFYKFEYASRFHVHVLAPKNAALHHIPRGGEVIKPIKAGDEMRVLGYLYKPHAANTLENLTIWIHIKRKLKNESIDISTDVKPFRDVKFKKLPRACGYENLPSIETWEEKTDVSVLSISLSTSTTNTNTINSNSNRKGKRKGRRNKDNSYVLPPLITYIGDKWIPETKDYG